MSRRASASSKASASAPSAPPAGRPARICTFEFRVKGAHQDPRVIARASEAVTLPNYARNQFQQTVASVKTQLTVAQSMESGVLGAD